MNDLKLRVHFQGIDRVSGMLGGIGSASQKAGRLVAQTTQSLKDQRKELMSVERELKNGTGNVSALIDRERELTAAIDRGNRELEERTAEYNRLAAARKRFDSAQATGDRMIAGGTKAVGVGVGIGAGAAVGVKSAMDLEEGMAGVAKVTDMSAQDLALMSQDLLDVSTRIPMAATGMAEIAAAAGAAGVGSGMKDQRQQLATFTEDAAKMGIAFDMTAQDAGSTMAKWRTAFQLTQPQVRALGDQVNALTNRFGGSAASVTDIVTKIGPLGKVAGLAAPQIAALGSTLNSIGVENDVAATGIKNMMLALTKGKAATKGQSAAFKELGLDAVQVSKDMQKNASGTIVDVMERVRKLAPAEQASILSELFGTESVGAISPLLTSLDGLKERLGLVGDQAQYAGSMNKEFLSRISTTKGATGLAMNALMALNIEMGQKLLPYVLTGANYVRDMASGMRTWAKENPALAGGLMKIVGVLSLALIAFGSMGIVGGVAVKALSYVRLGASMTGVPLKLLPKLFGLVRTAATLMSGGVVKAALLVGRVAPVAFNAIRVGAMLMAKGVARAGMMLLTNPIFLLGAALAAVAYLVYANWDTITAAFTRGVNWLNASWTGIKTGFADGVAMVGSVFSSLGARINTAWVNVKGAFNTGLNLLRGLLPSFKNIGAMIIDGLLSMLSPSRFAARLWNMGKAGIAAFKNVLGIRSPSRVFAGLGGFMTQGLAQGLDQGAGAPIRSARSLAAAAALAAAVPIAATPSLASIRGAGGAASDGSAAGTSARRSAARPPVNVTVNVYQQPGESGQDLAERIRGAIAREERRGGSSYADRSDYEDV